MLLQLHSLLQHDRYMLTPKLSFALQELRDELAMVFMHAMDACMPQLLPHGALPDS
jgi:hypothetical protein